MPALTIPRHDAADLLPGLLKDAGAGIDCSGASGSGKTNTADLLFLSHVAGGGQAYYFQPHGAQKLKRMILDLPRRRREKVVTVKASDPKTAVPVNCLRIRGDGLSDYQWRAKLSCKVGHTARILLASCGEGALGFAGRPLLRKWVTRWLRTLAQLGLTVADVKMFIDVRNPVYRRLCELVPDVMARHEMEELAERRSSEVDEILAAKNRFTALLDNPVIETILGKVGDGVLDMQDMIEQGYSIIFDLAPEGNLSDDDQQVIANIYLQELIHCLMNLPEHERPGERCLICIDEVALFEACAPLLLRCLCEIRKFARLALFHQGSCRFPGGKDNEFLKALMKMTRVHVYFRHTGDDARLFSEDFALASYDPNRVKFELWTPQQFQEGDRFVELMDESEAIAEGSSQGGKESQGQSDNDSWQQGATMSRSTSESDQENALRAIITRTKAEVAGGSSSRGGGHSTSSEQSTNWSNSRTVTRSRTRKQSILPLIRTRDILSSVTFYTPDEHDREAARTLVELDTGEAILHVPGKCLYRVKFPLAQDHLARTPKALRKLEAEYDQYLRTLPFCHKPEDVLREREQFTQALLRNINQAAGVPLLSSPGQVVADSAAPGQPEQPIILPPPDDPDDSPLSI